MMSQTTANTSNVPSASLSAQTIACLEFFQRWKRRSIRRPPDSTCSFGKKRLILRRSNNSPQGAALNAPCLSGLSAHLRKPAN
jgi:hypothetical protein